MSMRHDVTSIIKKLERHAVPKNKGGMARFGIETRSALGVSVPSIRKTAKEIRKDHELAIELWKSGIHEARILASMIDDPKKVTEAQMNEWVKDFDSWDLCDQCCMNLFDKTPFAYEKAMEWAKNDTEFIKRAGYAMMASLAVHDKKANDGKFYPFLHAIAKGCNDDRNFVKKAVNWALRQIGKRNKKLNQLAIKTANEIVTLDSKPARWIASDALQELQNEAVLNRLAKKA